MSQRFSQHYLDQIQQIHNTRDWGFFNLDLDVIKKVYDKHKCQSVLDYGCGRGIFSRGFFEKFGISVKNYDPGKTEFFCEPEPSDLIVCTDVLEHIEPECLDTVLQHLRTLTKKVAVLSISIIPAKGNLPDGRNMHLIVKPLRWWRKRLNHYFYVIESSNGILIAVPKPVSLIKKIQLHF